MPGAAERSGAMPIPLLVALKALEIASAAAIEDARKTLLDRPVLCIEAIPKSIARAHNRRRPNSPERSGYQPSERRDVPSTQLRGREAGNGTVLPPAPRTSQSGDRSADPAVVARSSSRARAQAFVTRIDPGLFKLKSKEVEKTVLRIPPVAHRDRLVAIWQCAD